MFFELPEVKTSCFTCPKAILSKGRLSPGFAGGKRVEPGGGDLGEFTFGKRWASDGVCVSNNVPPQFAIAPQPLLEPERLSGRISSGAGAPNTGR